MNIRKAASHDIDAIEKIYDSIHELENEGKITTGWITGIYPMRSTAEAALKRGDLFVYDLDGEILASAIINNTQVDVYADCNWKFKADDSEVCVLHTLVVDPKSAGQGLGTQFVTFYEAYAENSGCRALRIDTNARNTAARKLYAKLGYIESATVPCVFNGIPDVKLVLLEKKVGDTNA